MSKLGERCVCYLVKDNRVLLGKKKEGMGAGFYVGIGGKLEQGERVEEALVREVKEEIRVEVVEYKQIADLNFHFPEELSNWSQNVKAYKATKWLGTPVETDEIIPEWFELNKIPLDRMWPDAKFWLKNSLRGYYVKGSFHYSNQELIGQVSLDFSLTSLSVQK